MPKIKRRHRNNRKEITIVLASFFFISIFLIFVSLKYFNQNNNQNHEVLLTDGKFVPNEKKAFFHRQEAIPPDRPWSSPINMEQVLSATTNDEKWVEVDLTNQKLRAWDGNRLAHEFLVSTGKKQWGTETPVGNYRIWIKLRSTLMKGGSGDTAYYLPNVQCTQYFNRDVGLHGTYWHNNFGHPMSHGCVNLRTDDACTLFYWTSPPLDSQQTLARPTADVLGTKVVVHGETPED